MKKDRIAKIIFIILIIVLILAVFFILTHKKRNLTFKMYEDICNKDNYTFSMEEEGVEENYSLIVAKKQKDISIDTISENDHTTTLVKDGITYYVMHDQKEYYSYDSSEVDADIIKSGLTGVEEESYQNGQEKINGKRYYYEEFEGISTFLIWNKYDETTSIKTRFYFDNGKISYIKTIIGEESEVLKIKFSEDIDENQFTIPDDYAEI